MDLVSACRLCADHRLIKQFDIHGIIVEKCLNCNFVQVRDQPSQEKLKEFYSEKYFADRKSKYSDRSTLMKEYKRRLDLMQKSGIPEGAQVLEIGCAAGDFLQFAKTHYNMWGTDISTFGIKEAQKKNPEISHQLLAGPIEQLEFLPHQFDAIIAWDLIEHLWNPANTFRHLLYALKPKGYLVISTPNIGAPIAKLMKSKWSLMTVPEHLSFFNKSTIKYLFEEDLGLSLTHWMTKGKWVNGGFLMYKLKKMYPSFVPTFFVNAFKHKYLRSLSTYIPTHDIQYAVGQKKG